MTEQALLDAMDDAEIKAVDALARYKFQMFGYHAAIWVNLNRIGGFKHPNPFKFAVDAARRITNETPEFPVYQDAQGNEHAEY